MKKLTATLAAAALVLTACADSKDEPEGDDNPSAEETTAEETDAGDGGDSTFSDIEDYYEQSVEWSDCGSYECGTLTVPVDYAEPDGETIELNLSRVTAGSGEAIGSLIVNPGGPGGAGSDMVEDPARVNDTFGAPLRENYDIVGFDPRGTGESAPIDCLSDSEMDEYLAADPTPDDPGEVDEMSGTLEEFWDGCLERTGDLLAHVTTVESATDMDVLRAALGDDQLHYLGFSYGTRLGATYAELFPETAGRLVLDAAVDPELESYEGSLSQAQGFERALGAYAENCVQSGDCFLGDSVDAVRTTISDLIEQVDDQPMPTALGRDLEVGNVYSGIAVTLYSRDYWELLDQGLQQALDGDGTTLLYLADAYAEREEDGSYASNIMEAFPVISCLDDPASVPLEEIPDHLDEFEEVAPTMGDNWAWGLHWCADIPVEKTVEDLTIRAEGAAPIIVIGTTRDPATPYEEAVAMAEQLESGVLVTRDGDGHGGYGESDCVDEVVHALLIDGEAPDGDVDC